MEYAKLFDNGRRVIPPSEDMRIFYKEFLQVIWWLNASEEEKIHRVIEMEKKHDAQFALPIINRYATAEDMTELQYISNPVAREESVYWKGELKRRRGGKNGRI